MAMKKMMCVMSLTVMVVLILAAVDLPHMAEAVTCTPLSLSPCAAAISSSSPPSSLCCQRLMEQKPCLCEYLKNPSLKQYVNSPGAKKIASSCKVPLPSC
ncbi:hypothetical protein QN277_009034 [Acacia crassicarpa]|uniref:Bifunctional inhibitor/plant lipid transfer protein/seed storage helical domain-containing protein n=1 Tax=Acacia crassicarpa TaxID=499986 RepID=A0AAE1ISW8_9FABA|nr:hypothetical protein QN277_009034 [Acacia crassicarpa]